STPRARRSERLLETSELSPHGTRDRTTERVRRHRLTLLHTHAKHFEQPIARPVTARKVIEMLDASDAADVLPRSPESPACVQQSVRNVRAFEYAMLLREAPDRGECAILSPIDHARLRTEAPSRTHVRSEEPDRSLIQRS